MIATQVRLPSIRAVTDATGAVIATHRTDEFGVATSSTGSAGSPFRYTGEPLDASGLTYLRARFYDPTIGRFLTRDPFAGFSASPLSLNRYSYVGNNPATWSDPSGHCAQFLLGAAAGPPGLVAGVTVSRVCGAGVLLTTAVAALGPALGEAFSAATQPTIAEVRRDPLPEPRPARDDRLSPRYMDYTINGYYDPYTGDYDPRLPQCRSMKCKIAIVGGAVVIVTVLGYGNAQASSKAPKPAVLRLKPH